MDNKTLLIGGGIGIVVLIFVIITAALFLRKDPVVVEVVEDPVDSVVEDPVVVEKEEAQPKEEAPPAEASGVADTDVLPPQTETEEPSEPAPAPLQKEYCVTTFWMDMNNPKNEGRTDPNIVRSLVSQASSCLENAQAGLGWGPSKLFRAFAEEIPDADKYCVGSASSPYSRSILAKGDDCNKQGYSKEFNFWLPKDREHKYCVGTAMHNGARKYFVKTNKTDCAGNGWSHVFSF